MLIDLDQDDEIVISQILEAIENGETEFVNSSMVNILAAINENKILNQKICETQWLKKVAYQKKLDEKDVN